ncbi:hypothetical protein BpHYR1_025186 [Brachionus plicatilis]|uniref:Uncharacterized protein n=1 Tax=Brachionus plicatilis TaxID=10195 RepID=A0A3M7SPD8_BRAPC|nr:hypothetical protein BpHYR1_025186 [Brachionus plicatilis]
MHQLIQTLYHPNLCFADLQSFFRDLIWIFVFVPKFTMPGFLTPKTRIQYYKNTDPDHKY